jgi:hypothetical protein
MDADLRVFLSRVPQEILHFGLKSSERRRDDLSALR